MKDQKLIRRYDIINQELIGTSFMGLINLSYDEIKEIFGKPNSKGDGYKIDWEWVFKLNNTVLRIYNYKDGPSYTGRKGIKTKDIQEWHVGGQFNYDLKILEDYIVQEQPKYIGKTLTTRM